MSGIPAADPRRLDVRTLMDQGRSWSGQVPVEALPRLGGVQAAESEAAQNRRVAWAVSGELRPVPAGEPERWLRLRADADLPLVCQRCLGPVREHVAVDRWLRFVADETQAAQLDGELEEDVLALPRWLDLLELVEDELLLALPLVPRHAVCPAPLPSAQPEQMDEAPHPFAALAALKRPSGK